MEKLLSVVVPTYNMEKLLNRCLDSLILPSQLMDLLEIIVVIDGSTDHSSEIAHSYNKRFPNSFVVIDKENGNYGSCINAGLSRATGKYFRILDADDEFNTEEFIKFIEAIENLKSNVDTIITNYSILFDKSNKIRYIKNNNLKYSTIMAFDSIDLWKSGNSSMAVMHAITYRTDLLKEIDFKQQTGISYTDTEYVFIPMLYAQSIVLFDISLYIYHMGREGQTVTMTPNKKRTSQYYQVALRLLNLYVQHYNRLNINIRHNLLCSLKNVVRSYFFYSLIFLPKEEDTENNLKGLKKLILSVDNEFWSYLLNIKQYGIKYIYLWDSKNKYLSENKIFSLLLNLYHSLKKD